MNTYFSGRVQSVVFANEGNAFYILRMILDVEGTLNLFTGNTPAPVSVKGNVPGIQVKEGAWFGFEGKWTHHPKFGKQLDITRAPVLKDGWDAETAHKMLVANGVGGAIMLSIRGHFDDDSDLLEALGDPKRLEEVPGIAKFSAMHVASRWMAVKAHFQALDFLGNLGLPSGIIRNIWSHFGDDAEEVLTKNPWSLVEVDGISFPQADEVARRLGLSDPDARVRGAVLYTCKSSSGFGHLFLRTGEVFSAVRAQVPDIETKAIAKALLGLHQDGLLVIDRKTRPGTTAIYDPWAHQMEKCGAELLVQRAGKALLSPGTKRTDQYIKNLGSVGPLTERASKSGGEKGRLERVARVAIDEWGSQAKLVLSDLQKDGIFNALTAPVSILSGLPGTGKSTSLKAAVRILQDAGVPFLLCAPTGIAAKNLSSRTGASASTIHRAFSAKGSFDSQRDRTYAGVTGGSQTASLGIDGVEWGYSQENPHPADVIIVDESSMVDQHLMFRLLDCTKPGARVVFVGDYEQLPSVGPGNVLRDIIHAAVFPIVHLTQIFRQDDACGIIFAAHSIVNGRVPKADKDFRFIQIREDEDVLEAILKIGEKFYSSRFNFQILSPRHRGTVGVTNLNERLREILNPKAPGFTEVRIGKSVVREGDRIMVTKNNYKLKVFNGDVGKVTRVDRGKKEISIKIFGATPYYPDPIPFKDVSRLLVLAYACTIHKCVHPDTLVEHGGGLVAIKHIPPEGVIGTPSGPRLYRSKVHNCDGVMLTIRTRRGYSLRVTPEHGVDVWDGVSYTRRDAGIIKPGDWVQMALGGASDAPAVALPPLPQGDVRSTVPDHPGYLTKDVAEFFGLMVADGTLYQRGVRLAKRHADVVGRFAHLGHQLFGLTPHHHHVGDTPAVEFNSTVLSAWLSSIGGMDPRDKFVPEIVLSAGRSEQSRFLRGLFEDGTVSVRGGVVDHIAWDSTSCRAVREVRVMLLRLGVVTSTTATRNGHRLCLYGRGVDTFKTHIGFVSNFKSSRLDLPRRPERNTRIPVSKEEARWLRQFKDVVGLSVCQNATNRGYISLRIADAILDLNVDHPLIGRLLDRVLFHHEQVLDITPSVAESVCIEVPGGHRFIQDGFCGWNSQGMEYDRIVMPLVRGFHHQLQRNILYTAITRAKVQVVLVGHQEALVEAVQNAKQDERSTLFLDRIVRGLAAHTSG